MGLYDQALVRAYSGGGSNWLEDLIKAKAHVKAHFRKDPKTGKLVYIKEHEKEFDPHVVFAQGDKVKILHGDHAGKEMTVNGYSEEKHVLRLKHPDHPNVSIAPHRVEHSEKTHENTPGEVKKSEEPDGEYTVITEDMEPVDDALPKQGYMIVPIPGLKSKAIGVPWKYAKQCAAGNAKIPNDEIAHLKKVGKNWSFTHKPDKSYEEVYGWPKPKSKGEMYISGHVIAIHHSDGPVILMPQVTEGVAAAVAKDLHDHGVKFDGYKFKQNTLRSGAVKNLEEKYGVGKVQWAPQGYKIESSWADKPKEDASKGYVQTGGQGGSNPGGQFKGPDGKTYYMKFYKNMDQGRSEVLSNLVTDQLGLTSPKATIKKIELNGQVKEAMATEWMGDLTFIKNYKHDITNLPPGEQEQLAKHFLSSVLVGDRDVVGLVYDNLARTKDGKWICIDRGGSFKFRAQGGPKEYGANPIEFEGLTNPSINAQSSSIFNPILDNTVAKDPAKYISWLKGLLSADIDKAVKKAGLGQDIANTMAVRRDKLIEKIKAKYGNGGANENDPFEGK